MSPPPVAGGAPETEAQYRERMAMIRDQSLLFMLRACRTQADALRMAEHMPHPDHRERGVYVDMRERVAQLVEFKGLKA